MGQYIDESTGADSNPRSKARKWLSLYGHAWTDEVARGNILISATSHFGWPTRRTNGGFAVKGDDEKAYQYSPANSQTSRFDLAEENVDADALDFKYGSGVLVRHDQQRRIGRRRAAEEA
jgi:hypothetical protein